MRMVRPRIDLQLSNHLPAQTVFRKHPLDRHPDHFGGLFRQELFSIYLFYPARMTCVMIIDLVFHLLSGQGHFLH